jgi:hypothetical protein
MNQTRFNQAIAKIDAANAQDPHRLEVDGQQRPLEVVHAERRTAWIRQLLGEETSEALLLAARAQHIRRWESPRESYPRDRAGYLKWRQDLKEFHAEKTAEILEEVGYDPALIERVKDLILKKRLKLDPEVQALEDALCLVFLETQFSEFAQKEADKIAGIVGKTWRKMSPRGQQFALALPLTSEDRAVIEQALAVLPG